MEKNTIKINESQLKKIVSESLKNIVNEIGDTVNGQYMIGRAAARRAAQGANWRKKADSLNGSPFHSNTQQAMNNKASDLSLQGNKIYSYGAGSMGNSINNYQPGTKEYNNYVNALDKGYNDEINKQNTKENKEIKRTIKINEAELNKIVNESVKRVLKEINGLTADAAYVKAKQRYDQLVAAGQGNTAEAQKLLRQMNTFQAYNDFDTNDNPESMDNKNAYGNSAGQYFKDVANAYGMKNFDPKQWAETEKQYKANGNQYDYKTMNQNAMNQHQQFGNLPYVKNQNFANPQSPQSFGLQYNQGKKGFMGIGKQKAGWQGNPNYQG